MLKHVWHCSRLLAKVVVQKEESRHTSALLPCRAKFLTLGNRCKHHCSRLIETLHHTSYILRRGIVRHRPFAVVALAEPLPFVSLDVLPSLVPVVEQTAQRAVGLLATGLHAVEAHQVGDVTPYADGLFHLSKHDVRFVFYGVIWFIRCRYTPTDSLRRSCIVCVSNNSDRCRPDLSLSVSLPRLRCSIHPLSAHRVSAAAPACL